MATGSPIDWTSAWSELAWQHDRPHRPRPSPDASRHGVPSPEPPQAMPNPNKQPPIAVMNGVTGRSNPRCKLAQGRATLEREKAVAEMPMHATYIDVGQLVFISVDLASAEGELAVGLARAMQTSKDGDKDGRFMWFIRKEYCSKERKHTWSKTPTFRVAADPDHPSKPYVTRELLSKVLPLEVKITKNSKKDLPRLDASCVRLLRELCLQRGLFVEEAPRSVYPQSPAVPATATDGEASATTTSKGKRAADEDQRIAHRLQQRKRESGKRRQVIYDDSSANPSDSSSE